MSEKKEKSFWDELPDKSTLKAFGKGLLELPKNLAFEIPQSYYETFTTSPYGYKMGDYDLNTDDPNHQEYKKAYDFLENYKKTITPFLTPAIINPILKKEGFINTELGPNGLYTQRSEKEQEKIVSEDKISSWINDQKKFYDKYYKLDDIEIEGKWVDQLAQTIPTFLTQVGTSYFMGPASGAFYGSSLMYSDTYQTAREYDVNPQEAGRLSSLVSLVSFATNYGPSSLFNSYNKNPKLARDVFFNKIFKKGLHKDVPLEMLKGGLAESLQEGIDEITSLTAEGTYRDITDDEWWERTVTSASIGSVLGGSASGTFTRINNKKNKPILKKITEGENLLLPNFLEVDDKGNVKINIKEENFNKKEDYEYVKKLTEDKDFIKKINPYDVADKNRKKEIETGVEIPLNMMIFNELITDNPNFEDVDFDFYVDVPTSIMSDQDLLDRYYDPRKFEISRIKEGEDGYEEGKKLYKVKTLGSNIYNSSGGRIVLTKGANQDVYVEEVVEILYKKLETENPELKSKIDNWIGGMGTLLDNNNIGGPRGIELFSKWYTFNYLGYANDEVGLKDIVALPDNIVKEFDEILGMQSDGVNTAFLFKGGDPIITDLVEDVETVETAEDTKSPEESFRLTPQQEEFFKDSKVRDENGELLKTYHGTNRDFKQFGFSSDIGPQFFFSDSPSVASLYAKNRENWDGGNAQVVPAYLNIKNPLILNADFGDEISGIEFVELIKKSTGKKNIRNKNIFGDNILGDISTADPNFPNAYGDPQSALKEFLGGDNKQTLFRLFQQNQNLIKYIKSLGYDGIKAEETERLLFDNSAVDESTIYVAFYPEQIKSQFNPEPTSDPRMSFRIEPNPEYKGDEVRDNIYSVLPDKDTESNLRKKINRDPKIGEPKNKSKTLVNDNYRMTVGNKTINQWIKDVENNMTLEQIMEARVWYDNYIEDIQPLTDGSPESAIKFVLGSLVTQVNESPEGAINNLLLAYEEETSNLKGNKKAGLNDEAVRQLFTEDGKIKGGIGQKLFDFIDSAIGNNTRYLMGNDPKGGSPYTADIHTSRGRGFIDSAFYNALVRAFGKNKLKSLSVDFGGNPTETQYENTSAFGNKLTKKLNDINWMGQKWTTQQVQAVDWVNVINFLGDYGVDAGGTMGDAILSNTQKITSALVFGEGTPYSKKFPQIYDMTFDDQLKITKKINESIIKIASKITGVKSNVDFHKQGFWKDYSAEPTTTITTIASKDGIKSFIDILGYLAQQTSIVGSKNNPTGKNTILYFYDVDGNFKNLKKQDEFYKKLREVAPDVISGASSDYVMVEGKKIPALSVITNFKAPSKITRVKEKADYILKETEDFINLHKESLQDFDGNIDIKMALGDMLESNNNWEEKNNGQDYIERLVQRYGRGIQTRLENSSRKIESLIEKEISKNNESYRLDPVDPDELSEDSFENLDFDTKIKEIFETPPSEEPFKDKIKNKIISTLTKERDALRQLEIILKPISSVLEGIDPILKRKLRDFEYDLLQKTKFRREVVFNFFDKAKNMTEEDFYYLDLAFKNSHQPKIDELINKYGLEKEYNTLRIMLDQIRQDYIDTGGDIGFIENYIPRSLNDLDGLRQTIFNIDPNLQTLYNRLQKEAIEKKNGEPLTIEEKEHIMSMIMRGYKTLNSGDPKSAKPRTVKIIDSEINKFYKPSSESLMNYIENMTDVIEKRKFIGQGEINENAIAKFIVEVNERTPLTVKQEQTLKEVLNSRLNPQATSPIISDIKNSTYILTMGSFISAITQIGDLAYSLDQAGFFETLGTLVTTKKIKIEDIGIEKIGQEFTSNRGTGKAVDSIFKIVGLSKIDRLGKETLINSIYNRYSKEAKSGKISKQFKKDIESYFDTKDQEKINQLIQDFADGIVTEDVQILVFNKLLDHQPVTQSEMPQGYLNANKGRLLYQLKTFTIRQLDVIRRKIVNDIKNAKTYKEKALGFANFTRFLMMFLVAGVPKDALKDLILLRPIKNISDYAFDNLLQFIGASRYHIYQVERYGFRGIINKFVGPPSFSVGEELLTDIERLRKNISLEKTKESMTDEEFEDMRGEEIKETYFDLMQRIPVVGKVGFWITPSVDAFKDRPYYPFERSESNIEKTTSLQLKQLKEDLKKETLSNASIDMYENVLIDALDNNLITPSLYTKRLKQLYTK